MNHPKLLKGYTLSAVPQGFDQHCAFRYPDGQVVLDYVNHERCDFASETMKVDIPWPWIDGFIPSDCDWEAIGFFMLRA